VIITLHRPSTSPSPRSSYGRSPFAADGVAGSRRSVPNNTSFETVFAGPAHPNSKPTINAAAARMKLPYAIALPPSDQRPPIISTGLCRNALIGIRPGHYDQLTCSGGTPARNREGPVYPEPLTPRGGAGRLSDTPRTPCNAMPLALHLHAVVPTFV